MHIDARRFAPLLVGAALAGCGAGPLTDDGTASADSLAQSREVPIWSCQTDPGQTSDDVQVVISQDDQGRSFALYYLGQFGSPAVPLAYSQRFPVTAGTTGGGEPLYRGSKVTAYPLVGNPDQSIQKVSGVELRVGADSALTLDGDRYSLACATPQIPLTAADCPKPPPPIAQTGAPIPVGPSGSGPCDDASQPVGFSMTGYASHGGYTARDDTGAIQQALDQASPGQTVQLAAGTYCVTAPLKVPQGVRMVGAASGRGRGSTVIEIPAAVVWSNWCYGFCSSGSGCGSVNGVDLVCPAPPLADDRLRGKFVLDSFAGAKQVSIAHLTIHGSSDVFYATHGKLFDYYRWAAAPHGLSVDNNCNGGNAENPGWVAGVAGGISIGDYWSIDDVLIDSSVHWGLQDRSSGVTISNSTSSGPTCNDGIGGAGGSRGRNGNGKPMLLGADMSYGCPGVHVSNHTWTADFASSSSAMDMMDTVGVQLVGSANHSNSHLTIEGVRDALIQGNTFTGAGDIVLHSNEEYAWNDYYDSGGYQFEPITLSSDNQVLDNDLSGGSSIHLGFAAPLISVPFGGASGEPMAVAPWLGGPTIVQGNRVSGALTTAILWNGSDVGVLGGAGAIRDNVIVDPVTCPNPIDSPPPGSVGARCNAELKNLPYDWQQSALVVYDWADPGQNTVRVEDNSIDAPPPANGDCLIQGDFAVAPRGNQDRGGRKASQCGFQPEGLDCSGSQVDKKTMTCQVRKD